MLDANEIAKGIGVELTGDMLLSESQIVEASKRFSVDGARGVYFLISKGKVIYVGQSQNVYQRVISHSHAHHFDSFCYIQCSKERINLIESIYIHLLAPPLNAAKQDKRYAPMTLDGLLAKLRIVEGE